MIIFIFILVLSKIPFVFSENGLVAHKYGVEFSKKVIDFINIFLKVLFNIRIEEEIFI